MKKETIEKLLETVNAGLCSGLGKATPGEMCVEAVVCYAMGEPHGDEPTCVAPSLRRMMIELNDASYKSRVHRAATLRRLAVAQLGTAGTLDEVEFARRVSEMTIGKIVPAALRKAAAIHPDKEHRDILEFHARECEDKKSAEAARAAEAAEAAGTAAWAAWAAEEVAEAAEAAGTAAWAAWAAAEAAINAKEITLFAEEVVQILIDMKTPGSTFLYLTRFGVSTAMQSGKQPYPNPQRVRR